MVQSGETATQHTIEDIQKWPPSHHKQQNVRQMEESTILLSLTSASCPPLWHSTPILSLIKNMFGLPFSEVSVHGPWSSGACLVVADYTMDGTCGRGDLLIFPLLFTERELQEGLGCQHLCQEHVSSDLISFPYLLHLVPHIQDQAFNTWDFRAHSNPNCIHSPMEWWLNSEMYNLLKNKSRSQREAVLG